MILAVKCRALILVNFRNCVSLSDPNVVQHFYLISFETIHSHCVGLLGAPSEVPSVYSHIDIHIKSNICNCIFSPYQGKWRLPVNTFYRGGISKTVTTNAHARYRNFVSWFIVSRMCFLLHKVKSCSDRQQGASTGLLEAPCRQQVYEFELSIRCLNSM